MRCPSCRLGRILLHMPPMVSNEYSYEALFMLSWVSKVSGFFSIVKEHGLKLGTITNFEHGFSDQII